MASPNTALILRGIAANEKHRRHGFGKKERKTTGKNSYARGAGYGK
jgi:hypothetical protein